MTFFEITLLIVLLILCIFGLLITLIGLPGTWIIPIMALIYKILPLPVTISWKLILILTGLAIFGEILEYYIGAMSASKAGATKWGVAGAMVGGIIGAIIGVPIFLIGSLVGLFIGAFLGAFIVEFFIKEDVEKAIKAGIGAFKGRLGAIMVKELLGVVMIIILIISSF